MNLSSSYIQNGYRDGWIVLQRVKNNLTINIFNPYQNPYNAVSRTITEIPGEVLVSMDGNVVQTRDGTQYDNPVDRATVLLLEERAKEQMATLIGAGLIQVDYGESETERMLKEEIEELDRKQAEMQRRAMDIAEKRADLGRGHRKIQYKSTNVESTPTVWCPICNKYHKPAYGHPVVK